MKSRRITSLGLGLILFAGQSQATTIDFDSLAGGTIVGATFVGLGVTFVDAEVTTGCGGCAGLSPPNAIFHDTAAFNVLPIDPIEAIFAAFASTVSVTGLDIGLDGFQLLAYDGADFLIDSDSAVGVSLGAGQSFTLTVNGSIKRVEFSQISDGLGGSDGSAYDNFAFTLVPEPSTALLLACGLMGLGVRRRQH